MAARNMPLFEAETRVDHFYLHLPMLTTTCTKFNQYLRHAPLHFPLPFPWRCPQLRVPSYVRHERRKDLHSEEPLTLGALDRADASGKLGVERDLALRAGHLEPRALRWGHRLRRGYCLRRGYRLRRSHRRVRLDRRGGGCRDDGREHLSQPTTAPRWSTPSPAPRRAGRPTRRTRRSLGVDLLFVLALELIASHDILLASMLASPATSTGRAMRQPRTPPSRGRGSVAVEGLRSRSTKVILTQQ